MPLKSLGRSTCIKMIVNWTFNIVCNFNNGLLSGKAFPKTKLILIKNILLFYKGHQLIINHCTKTLPEATDVSSNVVKGVANGSWATLISLLGTVRDTSFGLSWKKSKDTLVSLTGDIMKLLPGDFMNSL